MDRDPLFIGSTRFEWPSALILWLIGLAIKAIINPKARPTKNANVERFNRTWFNHVGKSKIIHTPQSIQGLSDEAIEDRQYYLNSRNPHCKNQPPMTALPQLKHSNRPYSPQNEKKEFDMEKVHQYLSQWLWKRQMDTLGRISLGGYQRVVSKNHLRQIVKIRFDSKSKDFLAEDLDGNFLKSFSIPTISSDFLTQGV